MITLTETTPLIIARNEWLRKAENCEVKADSRLMALATADKLTEEIMSKARTVAKNNTSFISSAKKRVDVKSDPLSYFKGKLKCNGCGKTRNKSKKMYQRNILRYGSEEKMLKEYKCMGCR